MGSIIVLALAASVYPQLLAVVVIILTRPKPQPLLWACYLTSLVVSVAGGVVIFAVFRSRETAGTSSNRLGPAAYFVFGAIAVLVAILISTRRGRALVDRRRPRSIRPAPRPRPGAAAVARARAGAEQSLSEGSLIVACLVGAVLAVPGPFDFLPLGRLARHGYGVAAAAGIVVVVALIEFVLIEAQDRGLHDRPRWHCRAGRPLLPLDARQQAGRHRRRPRAGRAPLDRRGDLETRVISPLGVSASGWASSPNRLSDD